MQMIDAVVGRKWLGTASCVSFCGKRDELIWLCSPNASCRGNVLGARSDVTQGQAHLPSLDIHLADVIMVYAIVQSHGGPVVCDRSDTQGRLQPSVVRTHRKSQAVVGQTPHCTGVRGGGYMQKADSTGLIDEKVAC